jgi:hypothetical protein
MNESQSGQWTRSMTWQTDNPIVGAGISRETDWAKVCLPSDMRWVITCYKIGYVTIWDKSECVICLSSSALRYGEAWRFACIDSRLVNLVCSLWVVSFMPQPLWPQVTTPTTVPVAQEAGWVSASLDDVERRESCLTRTQTSTSLSSGPYPVLTPTAPIVWDSRELTVVIAHGLGNRGLIPCVDSN